MKFLSRLLVVLCVLGGLGYGSYTLGRYVLAKHLFGALHQQGASTSVASASIGKTDLRGGKPRVEVEVLPADSLNSASEVPSNNALERRASEVQPDSRPSLSQAEGRNSQSSPAAGSNSAAGSREGPSQGSSQGARLGQREFDDADGMRVNDGTRTDRTRTDADGSTRRRDRSDRSDRSSEDRPRRRRTRTRTTETSTHPTREAASSQDSAGAVELPSRADSGTSGAAGASEPDRPHRRRSEGSAERPRRARSESSGVRSEGRSESRGDSGAESPIPRAEGSGGGDSPIPQPE